MEIFKQIPMYRFLMYCNETEMERTVLDCGAGGDTPPLAMFAGNGYITHGIDCDPEQIRIANQYGMDHQYFLNVRQGDMRKLEFDNASVGFVYSYNSIFHMRKQEVKQSLEEMKRVLKPGGLLFANFLTVNDFRCGQGPCVGDNEYEQFDDDLPVIHSYYRADEPDSMFSDMELLYKEDRVVERIFDGEWIRQGFVDYIARKK
ncbi:class I SAM-dependent methyltransferase [Paenibacillus sp. sgz500958]|uniref:class I SAM-dependent methyltransferase n=1 Tax=Paenibacillus sp. sgz500958 TaxID=3242475 RepID=UPI0036D2388A